MDVKDPVIDRVAFSTSRTDIEAENVIELLRGSVQRSFSNPVRKRKANHERGYTNRWLIEIGFKKTKDFSCSRRAVTAECDCFTSPMRRFCSTYG
ncbi:hypothetical protein C440_05772 [Haloferax mucosum ATCC BAA-1512]|uniref:Transposase n=1 Tax=Haloferax mucosum ATCC BAA-1512 TaxID=662479 RepID=M0IKV2_9EURY|nr:hypothetical protein C440_05772 [Haloferax mucosum ATCC BAA-1512]